MRACILCSAVMGWHLGLQDLWDGVLWPIKVEGNRNGVLPTLPTGNGSWHVIIIQNRPGEKKVPESSRQYRKKHAREIAIIKQ